MNRRTLMKTLATTSAMISAAGEMADAQPARDTTTASRRRPFIEADDGTQLFCLDWGNGKPVVFCHPWALSADIWEHQLIALSEQGLRCIAYDRRGHGRSQDPGRGYDYDTLASDLAAVIEQLDLHDVTIIGYSMGSGEAARYVAQHGAGRISRVMLVSPVAPKTANNAMFESFIAGLKVDRPAFMTAGVPLFLGKDAPISPAMSQWVLNQFLRASPKAVIECMRAVKGCDHRPYLGALTMPTLIVQGDKDEVNPLELTGRKMAEAIAGSELCIYPGAPHGIVVTHRDQFTRDLLKFVLG